MSRFEVVWIEDAEGDLAEVWTNSSNREAVRAAVNRIDRELAQAPTLYGTHLSEGLRTIYREPLKVFFTIDPIDEVVEVQRLQFMPSSGKS
jgi:hypothetical protein